MGQASRLIVNFLAVESSGRSHLRREGPLRSASGWAPGAKNLVLTCAQQKIKPGRSIKIPSDSLNYALGTVHFLFSGAEQERFTF